MCQRLKIKEARQNSHLLEEIRYMDFTGFLDV